MFHIILLLGYSSKLTLVTCPLPAAPWTFISAIADHCFIPEATASPYFANLPMHYFFLRLIWHWNSALRISITPFLMCLCSQTTNAGVSARCPFCYKMQMGTILRHILRTVRSCIQCSPSAFIENYHLTNWLTEMWNKDLYLWLRNRDYWRSFGIYEQSWLKLWLCVCVWYIYI